MNDLVRRLGALERRAGISPGDLVVRWYGAHETGTPSQEHTQRVLDRLCRDRRPGITECLVWIAEDDHVCLSALGPAGYEVTCWCGQVHPWPV